MRSVNLRHPTILENPKGFRSGKANCWTTPYHSPILKISSFDWGFLLKASLSHLCQALSMLMAYIPLNDLYAICII
jgi:hypothetical protein